MWFASNFAHCLLRGERLRTRGVLVLAFESYALCIWVEFFICVASTRGRVFEDRSFLDIEHVIAHDPTA